MDKNCYLTGKEAQAMHKILSHEQDAPCPFCKKDKCEHWDGTGWINPTFIETSMRAVV